MLKGQRLDFNSLERNSTDNIQSAQITKALEKTITARIALIETLPWIFLFLDVFWKTEILQLTVNIWTKKHDTYHIGRMILESTPLQWSFQNYVMPQGLKEIRFVDHICPTKRHLKFKQMTITDYNILSGVCWGIILCSLICMRCLLYKLFNEKGK